MVSVQNSTSIGCFAATLQICLHCGGGGGFSDGGIKCKSLACSVFYERSKVQKELQAVSTVATDVGLYPRCNVEWF